MGKSYQWTPFYESLANKLLEYKKKRKELSEIIKELSTKEPLMKYFHFEKDWWKTKNFEIDPFSVIAIINRQVKDENRIYLAKKLAQTFSINTPIPEHFDGIPVLNNLQSVFDGADELWELFDLAIKSADEKAFAPGFSTAFEKAVAIKYNGLASITIALYWIRPYTFMPLDSKSRSYLALNYNTKVPKYKCTGDEYINFLHTLNEEIKKQTPGLTFMDISKKADEAANKTIETAKKVENGVKQINSELNYWWLNSNPQIWKFSNITVGDTVSYTLYNENGNKRRVFQNFIDAKKGDLVIGYESTPVKQIVALCKVSAEQDGKELYFEKTEDLVDPVYYNTLINIPELKDMEYFKNEHGTLFRLTKDEFNIIMNLLHKTEIPTVPAEIVNRYTKEDFLNEVFMSEDNYNRLVSVLENKKNVILQGAPGVGKTFAAKRLAYSIIGEKNQEQVEFIQFHQSYSYEDFMMGYKPDENGFKLDYGIFYNFCMKAAEHPDKKFFFIIDEINRGNMSKIFGELLMLIESDYRDEEVLLAYDHKPFKIPEKLYLIGLMNTADRSLAMIDYALRRRFSFYEMEPAFDSDGFIKYQKNINNEKFNNLVERIKELNNDIENDRSLGKGFRIGHSYLCNIKKYSDELMKEIIEYDIIPMLNEYWFDDKPKVQKWEDIFYNVFK